MTNSLVENGARLTLRDPTNGCYPLHYACALLKHEQIEIYLNQLDIGQIHLRDLNGNTPIVYLMVAFAFYLNQTKPLMTSSSKSSSPTLSSSSSSRAKRISPPMDSKSPRDQRLCTENTTKFQGKVINALKLYARITKHERAILNTKNRHGLSLNTLYDHLVKFYPNLETNEFFQIIRNELLEEIDKTLSDSHAKMSLKGDRVAFVNGSQLESKFNVETFLKKHLLINLNEMKGAKAIRHAKKVDQNLLAFFKDKYFNEKIEIFHLKPKEILNVKMSKTFNLNQTK